MNLKFELKLIKLKIITKSKLLIALNNKLFFLETSTLILSLYISFKGTKTEEIIISFGYILLIRTSWIKRILI